MKILIAEDDAVSRKILKGTLLRWGHDPEVCVDGKEALAVLESPDCPDIAILDWMMPEIDGTELCRRARQLPARQSKYIILLTGKARREDLIEGLQSGADDFVSKPFEPRELQARLNVGIRIVGLQKQIGEKVDELEVAMTRLRHLQQNQKLEALGRLATGVAHEINTPMQYIDGNLRFLQQSWETVAPAVELLEELPRQLRSLEADPAVLAFRIESLTQDSAIHYALKEIPIAVAQSLEGIQRVTRIVHAMRDFSNPSDRQKSAIDLNRAIEAAIAVAGNEWRYAADVETRFDPHLPPVFCQLGEIQQAVVSLLINAAQAVSDVAGGSGQRGKITISTATKKRFAEIQITDTGCGIPEFIHDKVFEPFFTTRDVGNGTGQSLALARAIVVQQHKGRIWFETEPGKGTAFFIQLPFDGKEEPARELTCESQDLICR